MTKHLNSIVLASVCAAAIAAFSAGANASMVTNGDFNGGFPDPVANGGVYEQVNSGDNITIPGWTVGPGNVDWIHGYWEGSSGSLSDYSVDLSGSANGSIWQVISGLVTGQWYNLTFDVALNPDLPPPSQSLQFTFGSETGVATGTTNPNTSWTPYSFLFQWTGGVSATLLFATIVPPGNCCWGPALDNVELSAVPLPAALPLFAAGLGVMGYIGSRRRRKAAPAA